MVMQQDLKLFPSWAVADTQLLQIRPWAQNRHLMAHLINYWWLMTSCPALSRVTKPSLLLSTYNSEAEIHADTWHLQTGAKLASTDELIPCRSWWSCPGSWWQPSSMGIGARVPQSQGTWLWKSIKSAKNHMAKSYGRCHCLRWRC